MDKKNNTNAVVATEKEELLKPQGSEKHKGLQTLLLVLIFLGILIFCAYYFFFRKLNTQTDVYQPTEIYSIEDQRAIVNSLTEANPKLSPEEREERIDTFFDVSPDAN